MGVTRVKKPSKRALKAMQPTDDVPDAVDVPHHPKTKTLGSDTNGRSPSSEASSHLAPPALSSRTSHSSLQSSNSSSSKVTRYELDSFEPSRIEVRCTPTKGNALFAASHIPKGATVLAEIPAVRLTAEDEAKKLEADEVLQEKFDQLSKKSQKDFKKLHDANKDGFTRLRSIYHSNCYNLEGPRSTLGGSCIGLIASRINHSCIPNVQFSFLETIPEQLFSNDDDDSETKRYKPSDGVMVFRALKAISKGKEIVANYESIYATRSQRQHQFQMHYGFQCDCDACTAPTEFWARDDERRHEMIKQRNKVDAIESRIVVKTEDISNSSETKVYYLKNKKTRDGLSTNSDDLVPLDVECCIEMIKTLEVLDILLVKEGLTGIELQRVRDEMDVWSRRAKSCRWSSLTSS